MRSAKTVVAAFFALFLFAVLTERIEVGSLGNDTESNPSPADIEDFKEVIRNKGGFFVLPYGEIKRAGEDTPSQAPLIVENPTKRPFARQIGGKDAYMAIRVQEGNCVFQVVGLKRKSGESDWAINEYVNMKGERIVLAGFGIKNPTSAETWKMMLANRGRLDCVR